METIKKLNYQSEDPDRLSKVSAISYLEGGKTAKEIMDAAIDHYYAAKSKEDPKLEEVRKLHSHN